MNGTLRPALGLICATLLAQTPGTTTERKVALVIGNDSYLYLPNLKTAVIDARAVQALLQQWYGFQTTLLLNANREQIVSALNVYRRDLGTDSSLLIYYAGHGFNDEKVGKAYWWPVDAKNNDNTNWIAADVITTNIKGSAARHVLIVSDSCYSGMLRRVSVPEDRNGLASDRVRTLLRLYQRPSRELLASGGNEPVSDGGGGQHSVFSEAFLRALERIQKPQFAARELFDEVLTSVIGNSAQTPQLDHLRDSGDDGGSFVFSRAGTMLLPVSPEPEKTRTESAPPPSDVEFKLAQLQATVTFQPEGYAAMQILINVLPNAGDKSYTAALRPTNPMTGSIMATFVNGSATDRGKTLSFQSLQRINSSPMSAIFSSEGRMYAVSAATLSLTLGAAGTSGEVGQESGNLRGVLNLAVSPLAGRVGADGDHAQESTIISGEILGTYTQSSVAYAGLLAGVPAMPLPTPVSPTASPLVPAPTYVTMPTDKCADGCSAKIGDFKVVARYSHPRPEDPSFMCEEEVFRLPDNWPGGPFLHSQYCRGRPANGTVKSFVGIRLAASDREYDQDTTIVFDGAVGHGVIPNYLEGKLWRGPWRVKVIGLGTVESMTIEVVKAK